MKKWLTVAVVGLIAAPLTGCASSDLQIDYRGPFTLQVSACVLLATSADLRDDRSTPNAIWVDSLTVGQDVGAGGSLYTVDGVTHVSIGSEQPRYLWSCDLQLSNDGSLNAEITKFELVQD